MDIDQILNRGLTQVMDYLKLEAGEVYLKLEDGKTLQMILHRGDVYQQIGARTEMQLGQGMIGKVAAANQSSLIDLDSSTHISREELKALLLRPELLNTNLKQIACFPLTGRSGVVGVLAVGVSEVDSLDELDTQFLSAISSWIGTVIENVRLNVQQRRLAVLEERERIGMDLHDGVIQDIYAVGLTLEHARLLMQESPNQVGKRIEQAINDLNNTIRDIRAYILDLRPRKLHEEDLMDGLRRLVAEFRANTLIDVTMQGPSKGDLKLRNDQAIALFHITQEALANIAKHARARHVNVALWSTPERALLEISDDGGGFDVSQIKMSIGHGLANMQTRARSAGGDVEFSSEPGSGTTILTWVPIEQEDDK
jgi:signal transduction histidine kinase